MTNGEHSVRSVNGSALSPAITVWQSCQANVQRIITAMMFLAAQPIDWPPLLVEDEWVLCLDAGDQCVTTIIMIAV